MASPVRIHTEVPADEGVWWRTGLAIETWLIAMTRRRKSSYVSGMLAFTWLQGFFISAPVGGIIAAYFFLPSLEQYVVAQLFIWLGLFVAYLSVEFNRKERGQRRVLREWLDSAGDDPGLAAAAFHAASRLPRERALRLAWSAALTLPVVELWAVARPAGVLDPAGILVSIGGTWVVLSYGVLLNFAGADIAMYPVRARASLVMGENAVAEKVMPMATRLILFLAGLTVLAGCFASTFVSEPGSSTWGITRAFAAAFGVALVMGLIPMIAVSHSLLAPVRELTRSAGAVAAGGLPEKVTISASDELGQLQVAFNQMIDGLGERDELRGENANLVGDLQASLARIVAATDTVRREIERDLHDGAQQYLVLMELKLGLLGRSVAEAPTARDLVAALRADLRSALAELRDLSHGLYPAVLESEGLHAALRETADRAPVPVVVEAHEVGRAQPQIEAAVYFCCLEALQNASRHAGDKASVVVRLGRVDGRLTFAISDDGVGFDSAQRGPGLQNLADRIGALGGELTIESNRGEGTTVAGSVPTA